MLQTVKMRDRWDSPGYPVLVYRPPFSCRLVSQIRSSEGSWRAYSRKAPWFESARLYQIRMANLFLAYDKSVIDPILLKHFFTRISSSVTGVPHLIRKPVAAPSTPRAQPETLPKKQGSSSVCVAPPRGSGIRVENEPSLFHGNALSAATGSCRPTKRART